MITTVSCRRQHSSTRYTIQTMVIACSCTASAVPPSLLHIVPFLRHWSRKGHQGHPRTCFRVLHTRPDRPDHDACAVSFQTGIFPSLLLRPLAPQYGAGPERPQIDTDGGHRSYTWRLCYERLSFLALPPPPVSALPILPRRSRRHRHLPILLRSSSNSSASATDHVVHARDRGC